MHVTSMIEQKKKKKERIDLFLFFSTVFSSSSSSPSPPPARSFVFFFVVFLMIDKRLMEQKVFVCSRRMAIDSKQKKRMSISIDVFPVMNY